jgi:hypothetical protein
MIDTEYLERGLGRRVDTAFTTFAKEVETSMAMLASKGMLSSGTTLQMFSDVSVASFSRWFADAAQFVFSAAGAHDRSVSARLESNSSTLIEKICAHLRERQKNTGFQPDVAFRQIESIGLDLLNKKSELLDDFEHGINGSSKLKPDPLLSLVANQLNSPGAVQHRTRKLLSGSDGAKLCTAA